MAKGTTPPLWHESAMGGESIRDGYAHAPESFGQQDVYVSQLCRVIKLMKQQLDADEFKRFCVEMGKKLAE